MNLLSPAIKGKELPLKAGVSTYADAVLAVHDVLQYAQDRAEVIVLCRSLHYDLRERLWTEVTGSTFASQLEEAVERGASVRLLLTNSFSDELISAQMLSLGERYGAKKFQMLATGKVSFFDTFPHFTMVKAGDAWFDYVEWKHGSRKEPFEFNASDALQGAVYLDGSDGAKFGKILSGHFDILFEKSRKAAKPPQTIAAFTLA